jgi:hypothetical protein
MFGGLVVEIDYRKVPTDRSAYDTDTAGVLRSEPLL